MLLAIFVHVLHHVFILNSFCLKIRDINYTITGGVSALHVAVSEGDIDVVRWLLENGSSVHLRDCNGHTPLWNAVEKDNMSVSGIICNAMSYKVLLFLFLK